MASGNIKVVIIDEDDNRKKLIKSYLPEYMDPYLTKYGEDAWKVIMPEEGVMADLVIMYADDTRGRSTYTFDWMKSQNIDKRVYKIPVVLITSDMFSDRALEFLEIGDAEFYEYKNEIDETELYSAVMTALDNAELRDDDEIYPPVPEKEPTSPDRIMGMSFDTPIAIPRTVVYNDEETIEKISKSVKNSIEQTQHVRQVISEAIKEMDGDLHHISKESAAKLLRDDEPVRPHVEPQPNFSSKKEEVKSAPGAKWPTANPAPNSFQMGAQMQPKNPVPAYVKQSKILVVDKDVKSEKAVSLFAPQGCEVVFVDSGMKAIDYFIKGTARLVIIKYDMPNINGLKIMASIRLQPNGQRVPIAILFEKDSDKKLMKQVEGINGVVGVIEKPIIKKQLNAILAKCN